MRKPPKIRVDHDEDAGTYQIYTVRGAGAWGTGLEFRDKALAEATKRAIENNLALDRAVA